MILVYSAVVSAYIMICNRLYQNTIHIVGSTGFYDDIYSKKLGAGKYLFFCGGS